MNREEAIYYLKSSGMSDEQIKSVIDAFTCEDCISRQEALKVMCDNCPMYNCVCGCSSYRHIEKLPSVTPQPKMGRWIMKHRTHNKVKHYTGQDEMGETHTISVLERYEADEPYCSECGKLAGDTSQDYCCACGAKMEVEE